MVTSDLLTSNAPADLGLRGELRATGQLYNVPLIHWTIVHGCDAQMVTGVHNNDGAHTLTHIEVMVGGLAGQDVILHARCHWQC